MSIQPGDEIEIEVPLVDCVNCGQSKALLYPDTHFYVVEFGVERGIFCRDCADTPDKKTIPLGMIKPIIEDLALEAPMTGLFRPVSVEPDPLGSSSYQYWKDMGHIFLETMALWQGKILKFSISGNRYKGLWLKPEWDGSRLAGLSIAGDTPSKKLELDIYQRSRLSKIGFQEEGRTNKTWSIRLSEPEGSIENSSSLMLHLVRFGYLLEPSDLNRVTPTLDIDLDDPEYKELRNRPRS